MITLQDDGSFATELEVVLDNELDTVDEWAGDFGVTASYIRLSPGNGHPVFKFVGTLPAVHNLLKDYEGAQ